MDNITWTSVLWFSGIPVYLICICCYKTNTGIDGGSKTSTHTNRNGKPSVQIFVELPTPPDTIKHSTTGGDQIIQQGGNTLVIRENPRKTLPFITEEITVQQAFIEDTTEKEAKIIDLLDQVIQAEEDSYGEIISLKEQADVNERTPIEVEQESQRKSLSELSDAGSDISSNQVLSKYDVVAQVHREDLPRLDEEEEVKESSDVENESYQEEVTEDNKLDKITEQNKNSGKINDGDDNSRTDESGYSDTLDKTPQNELVDDKELIPNIPVPPPLDENFFASPTFKKSYTISVRPTNVRTPEREDIKPRERVQSNGSIDDAPITFGSDKQLHFMSKLNIIFQNKIAESSESGDETRIRSNSAGNLIENTELAINRERLQLFQDLKKEIISRDQANMLKPVQREDNEPETVSDEEDQSMSKEVLKSKLENIFASGGLQPTKVRLTKSNPPTPEEAYQTDTSSSESISKIPKLVKNDTLKRQKDKFGEVLNSLRLSLRDDQMWKIH